MANTPPIHGNYRGYYTKRPSIHDPRLALIPKQIFQNARVLDVGCNEGWVTCEIAHSSCAKEVIGVDIDDMLVRAAWRRRRTVWSQYGQVHSGLNTKATSVPPNKKRKLVSEDIEQESFPLAFEHMFGPLPIPSADSLETSNRFPHNVRFKTADWVKDGILEDRDGYDVILALSLTKWIHLNDGDDGLLSFFRRIFSTLKPGGVFILEPQEWETYAKAKRMDPKLRETAKSLKFRPSDFERMLLDLGFETPEHLGTTGKGGFHRPVDMYRKPKHD